MDCPRGLCLVGSTDGLSSGTVPGWIYRWVVLGDCAWLDILMGCPRGLCLVGSTDGLSSGTVPGWIY